MSDFYFFVPGKRYQAERGVVLVVSRGDGRDSRFVEIEYTMHGKIYQFPYHIAIQAMPSGERISTPAGLCWARDLLDDQPEDRPGFRISHLLVEYALLRMPTLKLPLKHAQFIQALINKADEIV